MSSQLAPNHVLERIALEYATGGRYADRHLPQCKVAAIVAADPLSAINKKISVVVRNGGASASKMLRLYAVATDSGLQTEALKNLIADEAKRLVDRALELSARHGCKARIRITTLRALSTAGFVEESALKEIETNMLSGKQVRELVATYNGVDAIRWALLKKACSGLFQESTPVVRTRKSTSKRHSHQIRRREAGVMVSKPLTKSSYLKSGSKKASDKAFAKASRQANAKIARAKRRGNGKTKHSVGESPMCAKPLFELCSAGHVGVKVAK